MVRGVELAAWVVFVAGVVTMLARGVFLRSPAQKQRTGWIVAWTMMLTGPVFAVVYTLAGLGVVETFFGDEAAGTVVHGGHRGLPDRSDAWRSSSYATRDGRSRES